LKKLSKSLKKEVKEIENRTDLVYKKELKISDEEIKAKKKDLSYQKIEMIEVSKHYFVPHQNHTLNKWLMVK
jgi:hypothetical protein